MYDHLICNGFPLGYTTWLRHGERIEEDTPISPIVQQGEQVGGDMQDLLNEAFGVFRERGIDELCTSNDPSNEMRGDPTSGPNAEMLKFNELVNEENQELYEGCTKYSKLSFLVKLYHIKCLCRVTDKAMDLILELLIDAFENARLPKSFYEAKKTINKLGLNYKTIHACPNDCMLYWGDDVDRSECKTCNTSRWKKEANSDESGGKKKRKKKPAKVLRYFPLTPRLQRLFMSSKLAEHMKWHVTDKNPDGLLRHPRDGEAWKSFDSDNPEFAQEPRNVRLGLATDGFNPFGTMSTKYSIWPVLLVPYNFPPWMCMKQTSFMLSMIIPGKKMPGNNIDVYLQPLVKELHDLWVDGIDTYDSSSNQMFKMRAALLWTISDFPGLGNLSGWNTYGGYACPVCNIDQKSVRLRHGQKSCFLGHRRFLPSVHPYRDNAIRFDGTIETRCPSIPPTGAKILEQTKNINITFGKIPISTSGSKRPRKENVDVVEKQWRKRSIFFELPYWVNNKLRHNLDVMHIEKNVTDNVLYTLLNEVGRSKDNLSARKDLQALGIRPELWPDANGKYKLACFAMTNAQKDIFLKTLAEVTVPDGYSSNISSCVETDKRKISGLKSHDSHVLLEQLLPVALRNAQIDSNVTAVVIELCVFFRKLCSHVLDIEELDKLQERIVVTLCQMEMLFPPSFFTVMVHLVVHLTNEAKLGGPVHYRWMYPIERYFLNSYFYQFL